MLPTNRNLSALPAYVRLAVQLATSRMSGRFAYSTRRNQGVGDLKKIDEYQCRQRDEPNPEYHHAPRCFVKNFHKYQEQAQDRGEVQTTRFRNPRYRWADFRRRMVYGTYDI
ncbi:uncharacterized protein LOC6528562 [Drosophila yakuba]|uniref:Uncharacterized protein n=1 Tax=Drosophila yakuba TaxID=7245 RepID=B4P2Q7_DROYA|nr:uncharacterized protein LOC6528562 [Drosophila yakuba]XP_039491560.1 uncharacterized protein LOC120451720 [Drosophila santomea]EDW89318.1 uncharacterized protein Dyak_GE23188 [Drosophila yakuba]